MGDKMKKSIIYFLAAFLILFCVGFSKAEKDVVKSLPKVMVIQSYAPNQAGGTLMEPGFFKKLKEMGYEDGKNIQIYEFYMDTITTYKTPEQIEERAQYTLNEIKKFDPKVVVIFDDTAFSKVGLKLVNTKYQVVYGGVNIKPEIYDKKVHFMNTREKPGFNVTGVTEEAPIDKSVKLLKKIVPSAKTIAFISSNGGTFWETIANQDAKDMMDNPQDYALKIVDFQMVDNFEQYKKLILEYNKRDDVDAIYNYGLTQLKTSDTNSEDIDQKVVAEWILKNQKKPEAVWLMDWVEWGFLCGSGIDLPMNGKQVAEKLVRILNGEKAGDISIDKPKDFYMSINLARAESLGIKVPYPILSLAKKVYTEMTCYPEYQYKGKMK